MCGLGGSAGVGVAAAGEAGAMRHLPHPHAAETRFQLTWCGMCGCHCPCRQLWTKLHSLLDATASPCRFLPPARLPPPLALLRSAPAAGVAGYPLQLLLCARWPLSIGTPCRHPRPPPPAGVEFEKRILANEINNQKFNFLKDGDPYNAYYRQKVGGPRACEAAPSLLPTLN